MGIYNRLSNDIETTVPSWMNCKEYVSPDCGSSHLIAGLISIALFLPPLMCI
jgi:acetone carboxylase gamma subunit